MAATIASGVLSGGRPSSSMPAFERASTSMATSWGICLISAMQRNIRIASLVASISYLDHACPLPAHHQARRLHFHGRASGAATVSVKADQTRSAQSTAGRGASCDVKQGKVRLELAFFDDVGCCSHRLPAPCIGTCICITGDTPRCSCLVAGHSLPRRSFVYLRYHPHKKQ